MKVVIYNLNIYLYIQFKFFKMAQYGKQEYWEDRYQKDKEPFDWYQRYSGVKDIITQYVQPSF